MAACGSLQHIFDNPLPDNPKLIESLSSWNQIISMKPMEQPSFTELFSELHFNENSESSSSSSSSSSSPSSSSSSSSSSFSSSSLSSLIDFNPQPRIGKFSWDNSDNNKSPPADSSSSTHKNAFMDHHNKSNSFSSMNSESLQLCTEGLGFESSDDVENLNNDDWQSQEKMSISKNSPTENHCSEFRRSKSCGSEFPPPISCIGRSGKPWVCFKSYRQNGRFVLKEMRIPTQEVLHACREDGRLKLHFIQQDDEILEENEDDKEQDNIDDYGNIDGDVDEEGEEEREEEEDGNDEDNGEKEKIQLK